MRFIETTKAFFERIAKLSSPDEAFLLSHVDDPVVGAMVQETLRHADIRYSSMLRTSISPNIIKGGFRVNVIPGDAEATLDVRALPGEDMDTLMADLKALVNDPLVDIVRTPPNRPSGAPSPLDSELFRALERTQALIYKDAPTVPMMLTGATDMALLRAKGV
jgi:acetylornithine deacetylase/succinyl-diaminopimelate desuccinylase-like protein